MQCLGPYLYSVYSVYFLYCFTYFYSYISKRFYSDTIEFSKEYKNKYDLNQMQKEALIGIMLADGFLEREKPTHNTRLRVEHAYPEQESYVNLIHSLFF